MDIPSPVAVEERDVNLRSGDEGDKVTLRHTVASNQAARDENLPGAISTFPVRYRSTKYLGLLESRWDYRTVGAKT